MTNCNAFVSGAGGSNLGPVKSDTVLSTVRHRCNIFSKEAVLPGHNNAEKWALQTRHTPGPQLGGGKRGWRPLNKNIAPLNCPACPPKLPFPLRQFQDGGSVFFETNRELGEK